MTLCTKCSSPGPFYVRPDTRKGHSSWCKPCLCANSSKRSSLPYIKAQKKEWYLNRLYGLSAGDYDRMLAEQNGTCAICKGTDPGSKGRFSVDHNHSTGKVRSLLCANCNSALGMLKESPELFTAALSYLEQHNG